MWNTLEETGDTYVRVKQLEAKRSFLETQEKLVEKLQKYQKKLLAAETPKAKRTGGEKKCEKLKPK